MVMAASDKWFLAISIWLAVVSYLCSASFAKAVFSSQALVPISSEVVNTSLAPLALKSASLNLTSVIPISSSIAIADFPCSSALPKPSIKDIIALPASS